MMKRQKKPVGFKRVLGIIFAAATTLSLFPAAVTAADAGGFRTNLEGLSFLSGNWTAGDDGLRGVSGGGDIIAMSSTAGNDFVYEAKVKRSADGAVSLIFRSNDSGSECYVANIDFGRGTARIFTFGENAGDLGSSYALPDPAKKEFTLRLEAIGSRIRYFVDDQLAVSVTDSRYTSGKFGLLVYSGDFTYQDVCQTPVTAGTAPALTGLTLVGAEDSLLFDPDAADYSARVDMATESVKVKPQTAAGTSVALSYCADGGVMQNKETVPAGSASSSVPLAEGYTTVYLYLTKGDVTLCNTVKIRRTRGIPGDVNNDNELTKADIELMRDFIFENKEPLSWQKSNGDADGDGSITVADIVKLRPDVGADDQKTMVSYTDIVDRMTDLKSLAVPAPAGETCSESSAYNKLSAYNEQTGEYENWGQNDDQGKDAPRSEDGGYVIADMQGPGAIVRIWSADPRQGHIKIFIDGSPEPEIDMPFIDLFGTGDAPFNLPELCYDASRGKNCYVPITYNKSCKVILYDDWGMYYQVNYITLDPGKKTEPFAMPMKPDQLAALKNVNDYFASGMVDPPEDADTVKTGNTVEVPAHGSVNLLDARGAGAVTGVRVKVNGLQNPGDDWNALAEMTFSANWDKEQSPSVWTTLGGFFGSITGANAYTSLPCGVEEDGTLYANWYMPYGDGAVLTVGNDGDHPYSITYEVAAEPLSAADAAGLMRFHAKWNRAEDPAQSDRWPDSQFLYTTGTGRFVGTSLHVYKAVGTGDPAYEPDWWWGEGDEKFFVDGEKFPSWFGTGCEDFFGYAWGTWNTFSRPYHSQPFTNGGMFGVGNRLNNRFFILDSVPFQNSFDGNLEKYHRDDYANMAFTNFWYLAKGGTDPYGAVSLEERTAYYADPYPDEAASFVEGEDLKIIESSGMIKAETQDMTPFTGDTWSNHQQFILKAGGAGDYVKFRIKVAEEGDYNLTGRFTKAGDFGIAQHYVDGTPVGGTVDLYADTVCRTDETSLGTVHLTAGLHELEVRITGKNGASRGYFYGLDYMKIEKQAVNLPQEIYLEGENMEVTGTDRVGNYFVQDMNGFGGGWSGGKHLIFFPTEFGGNITLKLPVAAEGDYIISAGMTRAGDFGIARHSIDGVDLGNPVNLNEGSVIPSGETVLGRMHLSAGDHSLKITVIGSYNSGKLYALDFLRLTPYTPSADANTLVFEGEETPVTAHTDGIIPFNQHMFFAPNPADWSQKSQLTMLAGGVNQYLSMEIDVPAAGTYTVRGAFCKAGDFGTVQLRIDGADQGGQVDLYNDTLRVSGETALGVCTLSAGKHTVDIVVTGKNQLSSGYIFALDYLKLIKQ